MTEHLTIGHAASHSFNPFTLDTESDRVHDYIWKLESALRFYADKENWELKNDPESPGFLTNNVKQDNGKTARVALGIGRIKMTGFDRTASHSMDECVNYEDNDGGTMTTDKATYEEE